MLLELDLSCTPFDEECAQLGSENYAVRARKECNAWIRQLIRLYGADEQLILKVKGNPHDFGTYYTVVGRAYSENAVMKLWKMENGANEWDEEARKELELDNVSVNRN